MKTKILDIIGFINVVLIIYIMSISKTSLGAALLAIGISFGIFTFLFLKFFDDSSVVYWIELYGVSILVFIVLMIKVFNKSYQPVLNNEIWYPGIFFSFIVYQIRELIYKI